MTQKTAALSLFVWLCFPQPVFLNPCVVCYASYYGNFSQTVLALLQGSKYSLNGHLYLSVFFFLFLFYVYTLKTWVSVKSHT